jgi:hypothetical protein
MKNHLNKLRLRIEEDMQYACSNLYIELLEDLAKLSEENAKLIREYVEINPDWESLEDNEE